MSVARRKSLLNKDTSSAPQTPIEISEELREIVGDKINTYMLSVFLTDEKIIKVGSVQQKLGPLLRQRWLVLTDKPRLIILNGNIFEKKSLDESITPDMARLARKRPSISMDPSKRISGPVKDTISENSEQVIASPAITAPVVVDQPAPVVISRRKSVLNYFSRDADVTPVPVVIIQDNTTTSAPLNRRKSVLQFINDKLKNSKSEAIDANVLSQVPFNERRQSAITFSEAEKKELKNPVVDKPASQGDIISPLQNNSQLKSSKSIKKPNSSTSSVSSTEPAKSTGKLLLT